MSQRTSEDEAEDQAEEQAEMPDLSDRVRGALETHVDFSRLRELHAEAVDRFHEKHYDSAFRIAQDSVAEIGDHVRRYAEVSWIIALTSAHHILDAADKRSRMAKQAKEVLQDAVNALDNGSFLTSANLLEKLGAAVMDLYNHEMNKHIERVAGQGKALGELQAMGVGIATAGELFREAVADLSRKRWDDYNDRMAQLDSMVEEARAQRVKVIREAITKIPPELQVIVERVLESGDFISANYLLNVGQMAPAGADETPELPPEKEPKAGEEVRGGWIERVNELIASIEPLIAQAEEQGYSTKKPSKDLEAARKLFKGEKYAEALRMARKAYTAVKAFNLPPEGGGDAGKEEGAPLVGAMERPLVWCIYCGSTSVGPDSNGVNRCMDCGREVPYMGSLTE